MLFIYIKHFLNTISVFYDNNNLQQSSYYQLSIEQEVS
jgi:hypothetical protein